MGDVDVEFLEHVDSELPTVETRYMDSLIKVRLDGELVLVHCEFQTTDSKQVDMVRRNVGYLGRCYERYGLPIFSHVVYLHPNAGENDQGGIVRDVSGYRFIIEYKVIQLSKIDGKSVLEARQPGMMPFCPLMKPDPDTETLQWLQKCVETTISLSVDRPIRDNLLIGLAVMAGLVHQPLVIKEIIPEAIMQESSFYQYIIDKGIAQGIEQGIAQGIEQGKKEGIEQGKKEGIEQGIEKGAKEIAIEIILLVLDTRFQADTAEILRPGLESIDDIPRLKLLLRMAMEVQNLEDFIRDIKRQA